MRRNSKPQEVSVPGSHTFAILLFIFNAKIWCLQTCRALLNPVPFMPITGPRTTPGELIVMNEEESDVMASAFFTETGRWSS